MIPYISTIILSWNTKEYLQKCLQSLGHRLNSDRYEVIVVDNASDDGSIEMVRDGFPAVNLIVNKENLGYAGGNNIGIRMARADHILLLNSDIEIMGNAPEAMCDFLEKNDSFGAVAACLVGPDGSIQKSCRQFPNMSTLFLYDIDRNKVLRQMPPIRKYCMRGFDHVTSRDVEQPPTACFMITKRIVEEVGVFDKRFYLFFNDVDLCKRIRNKGYGIWYLAESRALHHEGISVLKSSSYRIEWHVARYRYYLKWHGSIAGFTAKLVTIMMAMEEYLLILTRKILPSRIRDRLESQRSLRDVNDLIRIVWKTE
ncbi:glycosyltransferase family 2 protein [Thermodesulfobacteriota bacterium]